MGDKLCNMNIRKIRMHGVSRLRTVNTATCDAATSDPARGAISVNNFVYFLFHAIKVILTAGQRFCEGHKYSRKSGLI